ncbi:unnamed protein product [Microthlaspi erraticum]|uniref:KIB1-4 beta-propeller domain-containing protein n=1 Tax=Microthlaspi erraticum TaxID=1685480 RepID=A0A6D2KZK0_9BRAS|nr:unnamed protein product [Microthlaspi erraticum]
MDFSGQQGFKDVTVSPPLPMIFPIGVECFCNIAVTIGGEVLLVATTTRNVENGRSFRLYKMDPEADPDDCNADLLEVDSLGDEALLTWEPPSLLMIIPLVSNQTLSTSPSITVPVSVSLIS